MAKAHVLDTSGGLTTVAFHIAVPNGNNSVGTAWTAVVINSGVGGTTRLPSGSGTGGTISTAEMSELTAGTTFEVVDSVPIPLGMNATQANAFLDALHAAKVVEVQGQIQRRLAMFGYTRS